jgi:uncharacterized repeat protein (TIGR01451 family)
LPFELTTVTAGSGLRFEETLQPGYSAGAVLCEADGQADQPGSGGEVDLTVGPGEEWTCTFNNSADTATITVVKEIDDAPQPGWTFDGEIEPDGPAVFADTDPPSKEQSKTTEGEPAQAVFGIELVPDGGTEVTITEQPQPGFVPVGLECTVNGESVEQADDEVAVVEVSTGDEVVCTFENREAPGTITIAKDTVPASTQEFEFTTTGLDPAQFELADDGTQVFDGLLPDTYTVTETDPGDLGWSLDSIECEGDVDPVIDGATVTIELGEDESVLCTYTNVPNTATVNVVKLVEGEQAAGWTIDGSVVDPDADAARFTAPNPTNDGEDASGDTLVDAVLPFELTTVTAGSDLHFEETLKAGYSAGAVLCEAEGQDDQPGSGGEVDLTVGPGEVWTCTFNNTLNTATVNVVKLVDGVQTAGWTINGAIDDPDNDPARFTEPNPTNDGEDASGVTVAAPSDLPFGLTTVAADGSTMVLSEVPQDGFTVGDAVCVNGDAEETGVDPGAVELVVEAGDTWTCTFNNFVNTSTVEVRKQVAGVTVADWTFDATLPAEPPPTQFEGGGKAQQQTTAGSPATASWIIEEVPAAGVTVNLAEVLQEGYSFGGVTCAVVPDVGDPIPISAGDAPAGQAEPEVLPGQLVRCTFANNLIPASISLVKTPNELSVSAGSNASFTILVTNDGQVPLTNVVVTDPVPIGTSFVATSVEAGNPGSCAEAAAVITCTLEDLFEVGETSTIRVVVNVPAATSLTSVVNVATVTGDPPVCPPTVSGAQVGVLATGCPVTSTDDASVPVVQVGGSTTNVDAARVVAGTLPFTGPPGAALLKSGAWLLALGGVLQVMKGRRRAA